MDRNESRARELLAEEFDSAGFSIIAADIRSGSTDRDAPALRAIAAALRESEEWRRDAERYKWLT
jgi:hypothetical protein